MALSRTVKVCIVLGFSITLFLLEAIVGYIVGSIALVADSFHMLNDVLGFVVALVAMRLAKRQTVDAQYTYGWKRAEVLGALINAVLLLGLCLTIYIEAIQRFFNPNTIHSPEWMLGVGCAGLAFNLVGIFLFQDAHVHAHGGGSCSHGHGHSHSVDLHSDVTRPVSPDDNALITRTAQDEADVRNDEDTLEGNSDTESTDVRDAIISVLPPDNSDVINHPVTVHHSIIDAAANLSASYREHAAVQNAVKQSDEPTDQSSLLESTRRLSKSYGSSSTRLSPLRNGDERGVTTGTLVPTGEPAIHHHDHDHGKGAGGRLNMHAVFLHVLGDALANLAVIGTALVIWFTDHPISLYFDPVISLIINTVIVYFTIPLVKSASYILLQSVPNSVSLPRLQSEIETIPEVLAIHELHVWQLSDTQIIASAHVFVAKSIGEDGFMDIAEKIKTIMHRHGIHSTTIQPEFVNNAQHVENNLEAAQTACLLRCAQTCTTPSCCPVNDQNTRLIDSGSTSEDDQFQ
ncbi:Zinc resistance conferring protein [Dispira simplex]|nr:Zinc resistance conferring protein [Dispira simplex]